MFMAVEKEVISLQIVIRKSMRKKKKATEHGNVAEVVTKNLGEVRYMLPHQVNIHINNKTNSV